MNDPQKKILIVDDSETLREQVKKVVSDAGFEVLEAFDGLNGFEVLSANQDVKLIICDVNMPRLNGLGMCQRIHETPGLNTIPIFMLTTESNSELKAEGKKAGVTAWITKPFVPEKLVAAIHKVVK